jgi:hypothetical protein
MYTTFNASLVLMKLGFHPRASRRVCTRIEADVYLFDTNAWMTCRWACHKNICALYFLQTLYKFFFLLDWTSIVPLTLHMNCSLSIYKVINPCFYFPSFNWTEKIISSEPEKSTLYFLRGSNHGPSRSLSCTINLGHDLKLNS